MRSKTIDRRDGWWRLGAVLSTIGILLFLSPVALAQETTGGITGTVLDTSGAVVPGAQIEVTGENLVGVRRTESGPDGTYTVYGLPPGTYSVTVTAQGFVKTTRDGILVAVGRLPRVDITLEVGQVTEAVTVSAEALILDTTQSAVAYSIDRRLFDGLPKTRSFDSMIAVAPGARYEADGGGFQLDGASGSENSFVINGVEVTNIMDGTLNNVTRIPFEFVEEVQVKNSGFAAEYGGAMGGVVNTVFRTGANEFHGDVGFYFENDSLRGKERPLLRLNPFDDNIAEHFERKKDGYRNNMPGFTLGGPIVKNRIWFFTGYYPQLVKHTRTVTFLADDSTRTFEQKTRNDFFNAKLDFAPADNVRFYLGYLYSPRKRNGLLPSREGTDNPNAPWADRGWRVPHSSYFFGGDYTVTPRLLLSARGGYDYTNYKDYGIPRGIYYRFMTSNIDLVGLDGTPVRPEFQHPRGVITASNRQTVKDIQSRFNLSVDGSYMFNAAGNHSLKIGWQLNKLYNDVFGNTWPDGYIRFYWDLAYRPVTKPELGAVRGNYGYYRVIRFMTQGDVSSDNHAIFFQDNWRVNSRLTLNLGLRMEYEYLPSFRVAGGIPSKAIEFNFSDKMAPRLGFAYDVLGNGKWKLFGSFGLFYDMMKYEMPRGSFGGDQWIDSYYTLDTDDFWSINLNNLPGTHIEDVDRRIPSNDPRDNRIDPNLMPTRKRTFDFGTEHGITDTMVLRVRYNYNKLDRTIEDVGVLGPRGEEYYIANPGYGITQDRSLWGEGIPSTPKARRTYHAIETQLVKRFGNFQFITSYTWSRLWGNYSGLASSDEEGRTSPNVNRFFDLPWLAWQPSKGDYAYGRLGTDRPHTFKFFGTYALNSKLGTTHISPVLWLYSGTPVTTAVEVMGGDIDTYPNGRGDWGRTPVFEQFDFAVIQDFKITERYTFRFEFNAINLFDSQNAIRMWYKYNHAHDGYLTFKNLTDIFKPWDYRQLMQEQGIRVDPRYGMARTFQGPRQIRFGFKFIF